MWKANGCWNYLNVARVWPVQLQHIQYDVKRLEQEHLQHCRPQHAEHVVAVCMFRVCRVACA